MGKEIKIYTKTGDDGTTSLIGGTRVPKFHPRIDAYGTVDELNAYIGMIRDLVSSEHHREILLGIQDRLFTLESLLARDPGTEVKIALPALREDDVSLLEKEMDDMNESLPGLRSFILPGGHPVVSWCHIARCVCRRAERTTLRLSRAHEVEPLIIRYLNRLSDYLFVLSRKLALDLHAPENPWKAKI